MYVLHPFGYFSGLWVGYSKSYAVVKTKTGDPPHPLWGLKGAHLA